MSLPDETHLTFREGNMNRPLCKEIMITDDNDDDEGLEEFHVTIELLEVESIGVEVDVEPQTTVVKIIDNDSSAPEGSKHNLSLCLSPPPSFSCSPLIFPPSLSLFLLSLSPSFF